MEVRTITPKQHSTWSFWLIKLKEFVLNLTNKTKMHLQKKEGTLKFFPKVLTYLEFSDPFVKS